MFHAGLDERRKTFVLCVFDEAGRDREREEGPPRRGVWHIATPTLRMGADFAENGSTNRPPAPRHGG